MPFQKTWRNYVIGDLLYGLAGPRSELANHLGVDPVHTIDQYEIATVDRGHADLIHDPDFIAALKVHPRYVDAVSHADVGWDLTNNNHWAHDHLRMTAVAKRKCKGGLYWITQNTLRHIHFCLEGLDMSAVAGKNYNGWVGGIPDEPKGKAAPSVSVYQKSRSITGQNFAGCTGIVATAR